MKLFPALRAVGLAGLIVALSGFRLFAQDVTVTDPAWFDPEKPGADVLPQFKKKPSPDYPDELKKEQPGYVIAARMVVEDGSPVRLRERDWASNPYFQEGALEKGAKFSAATTGGNPVRTVVWYAVIFNPKTAKAKGSQATPRLLAVAPVVVSKETLATVPDAKDGQVTVSATVTIDAGGVPAVKSFDVPAHEMLRGAIEKALPSWKFAPARKDGQPVEAEIPLAFWVTRGPRANPPANPARADKMPEVISREQPHYPPSLRRSRQQGDVLLSFVVDEKGAVKDAVVVRSDNPAFEEPALEALQKWKFKPGTANGKPVPVKMRQSITFNLQGTAMERGALQLPDVSAKEQAKLPEELRYDVAPKPKGVLYPAYPFELLMSKTGGKAEVAFLVGTDGRVAEIKVIKADHAEFGEALSAAVAAFEFVPALKDGKPTMAMFRMEHEFDAAGWGGRPSDEDLDMVSLLKKHPERVIDPKALGYAAAQAAGEWRFEEPKAGGKSVVARVRVPFKFSPAKKPADVKRYRNVDDGIKSAPVEKPAETKPEAAATP